MKRETMIQIRQAVANYMASEGCDCCRNRYEHDAAKAVLAKLLRVPKCKDGSGYDFGKFEREVS